MHGQDSRTATPRPAARRAAAPARRHRSPRPRPRPAAGRGRQSGSSVRIRRPAHEPGADSRNVQDGPTPTDGPNVYGNTQCTLAPLACAIQEIQPAPIPTPRLHCVRVRLRLLPASASDRWSDLARSPLPVPDPIHTRLDRVVDVPRELGVPLVVLGGVAGLGEAGRAEGRGKVRGDLGD